MQEVCFKSYLQDEFLGRIKRNQKYSLRAFAGYLNISPSALSAILNGKRPLSDRMIERLGLKLGLDLSTIESYQARRANSHKTSVYEQLTMDQFALISDWYHYAILELLYVQDFESDAQWIANALGISKSEVNFAIERLKRLNLLKESEEGELVEVTSGSTTNMDSVLTSEASRRLQKQTLELAIDALEKVDYANRDHSSMTVAIDPDDMVQVKKMITDFRRNLTEFLERKEVKDQRKQVYQLNCAFFPLSR